MSPIPKQKLCWHCEGNVSIHDDNCPYCGVYLNPEEGKNEEYVESETVFSSSFEESKIEKNLSSFDYLKPLTLLLLGSTLMIFGFILFLFNQKGVFTLQWNADAWYLYLLVALPLLWIGWLSLKQIDDE